MARIKEFDREVVLERAMQFFWSHGYQGASMRDLLDVMDIGRQSLYDTFGDKHSLFLASLNLYYEAGMRDVVSRLGAPDGGLAAMDQYFDMLCHSMCAPPCRSCLIINTANELAPSDPEVGAIVNRFLHNLQQAFSTALEIAVAKGEVRVIEDIDRTAWRLTNSAMGFGTLSKANISHEVLRRIAGEILDTVRM